MAFSWAESNAPTTEIVGWYRYINVGDLYYILFWHDKRCISIGKSISSDQIVFGFGDELERWATSSLYSCRCIPWIPCTHTLMRWMQNKETKLVPLESCIVISVLDEYKYVTMLSKLLHTYFGWKKYFKNDCTKTILKIKHDFSAKHDDAKVRLVASGGVDTLAAMEQARSERRSTLGDDCWPLVLRYTHDFGTKDNKHVFFI